MVQAIFMMLAVLCWMVHMFGMLMFVLLLQSASTLFIDSQATCTWNQTATSGLYDTSSRGVECYQSDFTHRRK